jgi:hypothetical protein
MVPDAFEWPVFIETGSYHGDTIFAMEPHFDELHTVELSDDLYRKLVGRYHGAKIRFHHGDSAEVFASLLPSLQTPAIFYLDGHWSCGGTARGPVDVPLLQEMEAISRYFSPAAVIIVDDLRLFGQGPHCGEPVDWTGINPASVREAAGPRLTTWTEDSRNDKLILRLAGI